MKGLSLLFLVALSLSLCSCSGAKYEDSFHIRSWEENILNGDRALQRKEFAEAINVYQSAVLDARAMSNPDMRLAIALEELGTAYFAYNDLDKASITLKEALAAYDDVKPSTKEVGSVLEDGIAKSCTTLAQILLRLGSVDEANKLFLKALSIYEQQLRANGSGALVRREILKLLVEIGDIEFQGEHYFEAEERYKQALKLLPEAVGVRQYERRLLTNYRKLLKVEGKPDEQLLAIMSPQDTSLESELKHDWQLARKYLINNDYDKAEELYLESSQKAEMLGEVNPELIRALTELSRVYVFKGNLDKASVCLNRAILLHKRIIGPADMQTHKLLKAVISLQLANNQAEAALDTLKRQWAVDLKLPDNEGAIRCKLQNRSKLALVLHKLGREQDCDKAIEETMQLISQTRQGIVAFHEIGNIYLDRGDFAKAETLFRKLIKNARKRQEQLPGRMARALTDLANCYAKQGKLEDAERLYREAIEIMRSSPAMMRTSDYIQLIKNAATCIAKVPGHELEAQELLKDTLGNVALPSIEETEQSAEYDFENIPGETRAQRKARRKAREASDGSTDGKSDTVDSNQ